MRLVEKVSSFISSQDESHYLAIFYLASFFYLTMKNPLWPNDIYVVIPMFICSIGILACLYLKNKELLNKIFNNGIVKWIMTAFIYSLCLWIAKFKLNVQYGISSENINYSAIAYAFVLSFPVGAIVCGFVVLVYVFLRDISLNKLVIASLISIFIANTISHKLAFISQIEIIIMVGFIITIPYSIINLITILVSGRKPFKFNRLLTSLSYFAVFISLFTISISMIKYMERFQEKFLFLDAYRSTSCSYFNDNSLYIRKDSYQCYKVVGDRFSQLRLVLTKKVTPN